LGVDDQIVALQYFLNELHSPSEISVTRDKDLRIMQECDAILLGIFNDFCHKHQLDYWLDYGTLLGAVRHNGFIPWDDDMDVAMPRHHYQKALFLMKKELEPMGFEVEEYGVGRLIGLGYKHRQTGIWLDIFPVDEISCGMNYCEIREKLMERILKYRKYYNSNKGKYDASFFDKKRKFLINDYFESGHNNIIYHGPEFKYLKILLHNFEEIYPLNTLTFEGIELNVPHEYAQYLSRIYGNNFWGFPKNGITKHDLGRGPLSTWAKKCGIDMNIIKNELQCMIIDKNTKN
jgi:lipopolysaccharide cholinephosphotransferase